MIVGSGIFSSRARAAFVVSAWFLSMGAGSTAAESKGPRVFSAHEASNGPFPLSACAYLHPAAPGKPDIQRVLGARNFRPLPGNNLGYRKGYVWLRCRVMNQAKRPAEWLLVQDYHRLDILDLYKVREGKVLFKIENGDHRPAQKNPTPWLRFRLSEPPDSKAWYYLRARSTSRIILKLHAMTPAEHVLRRVKEAAGAGFVYGSLLFMSVTYIFMYFIHRRRLYLHYAAWALSIALVFVAGSGLGRLYVWPGWYWFNDFSHSLLAISGIMFGGLTTRRYLDMDKNWPAGNRIFLGLSFIGPAFLAVAVFFMSLRVYETIAALLVLPTTLMIIFASVRYALKRYVPAYYLVVAVGLPCVYALAFIMAGLRILPHWLMDHKVGEAFLLFAAIVISMGIARMARETDEELLRTAVSLDYVDRILSSIKDAVFVLSNVDEITRINPAAAKFLGYREEELLNRKFGELLAAPISDGAPGEYLLQARNGTVMPVSISTASLLDHDGRPTGIICVARDNSERRKFERELQDSREAAEAASRAKSEFLANMSHEIRTPLNAILGMAELLSETRLDGKQKEMVNVFQTAGRNLLHIINDILELSRSEAGNIRLESLDFDLYRVLRDVERTLLSHKSAELDVAVEFEDDVPRYLRGDPYRLTQVVLNLMNNGVKFTKRGHVILKVARADPDMPAEAYANSREPEADDVVLDFRVSDTGIGISRDKLDTLFERFTQAEAGISREFGGTGLGLAISRRLVELMGGDIGVASRPGKGSTFFFTAVFKPGQKPPDETHAAREHGARTASLRILIAEDNEDNRLLVHRFLESTGHELEFAGNGVEAIKQYQASEFDLVLMDIQMPRMNGIEATRAIRQWEREHGRPPVPIIALTAYAMKEDRIRTREAGCTAHLTKPLSRKILLDAVAKAASSNPKSN